MRTFDIVLDNHSAQNDTLGKLECRQKEGAESDPFVNPGEWKRLIDRLKARFEQMLDDEVHDRDWL